MSAKHGLQTRLRQSPSPNKKRLPSSPLHSMLFGRTPTSTAARHASDVSACSNDTTLSSETTAASPAEEDPYARRTAAQGTGTAYVEHDDHNVSCWDGPKPEAIRVAGSRELCEMPSTMLPHPKASWSPQPPQNAHGSTPPLQPFGKNCVYRPPSRARSSGSTGSTASKLGDQAIPTKPRAASPWALTQRGRDFEPHPPTN